MVFFKLLPDLNTVLYPAFLYTFRNFSDTPGIHGKVIVVDSFFVSKGVSDSPFVLVFPFVFFSFVLLHVLLLTLRNHSPQTYQLKIVVLPQYVFLYK